MTLRHLVATIGALTISACDFDAARADFCADPAHSAACGLDAGSTPGSDGGGTIDSGTPGADAGPADAGPADAGPADAGPPDAGPPDAGPPDAGPPDAGPPDAGPPDAGPPDAGPPDAGPPDAGPMDAGTSKSGLFGLSLGDSTTTFLELRDIVVRDGGFAVAGSLTGSWLWNTSRQPIQHVSGELPIIVLIDSKGVVENVLDYAASSPGGGVSSSLAVDPSTGGLLHAGDIIATGVKAPGAASLVGQGVSQTRHGYAARLDGTPPVATAVAAAWSSTFNEVYFRSLTYVPSTDRYWVTGALNGDLVDLSLSTYPSQPVVTCFWLELDRTFGTVSFNHVTMNSGGGCHGAVIAASASGAALWIGSGWTGTGQVPNGPTLSTTSTEPVFVRLGSDGGVSGATLLSGLQTSTYERSDYRTTLAIAGESIWTAATINGVFSWDGGSVNSSGGLQNLALLQLDSNLAVRKFSSIGNAQVGVRQVRVAPDGFVYVLGWYHSPANGGLGVGVKRLVTSAQRDGYVARFTPDGGFDAILAISGPGDEDPQSFVVDARRVLTVTGSFSSTLPYDGGVLAKAVTGTLGGFVVQVSMP